jgi:hypothetical protein
MRRVRTVSVLGALLLGLFISNTNTAWATIGQGPTGTWCPAGGQQCVAQFSYVESAVVSGVTRVRAGVRFWCYRPNTTAGYQSCYTVDLNGVALFNSLNQNLTGYHGGYACNFAAGIDCPRTYYQFQSSTSTAWGPPLGGDRTYSSRGGATQHCVRPNFSPSSQWCGFVSSGNRRL